MGYVYLTLAVIAEVIATSALKVSDGFSNLLPSIVVVVSYSVSFYFLAIVLKTVPIGVAYAMWCGLGIVLIAIVGAVVFDQQLDLSAVIGMLLIIAGIAVMNIFSTTAVH